MSADVDDAKGGAPVRKTARKRQPAKSGAKRTVKPIARRRSKPIVTDAPVPDAAVIDPASSGATRTVTAVPVASAPAPVAMDMSAVDPSSTVQAPPSPASATRASRSQWVVLAAAAVLVLAAVAFPRGPAALVTPASDGPVAKLDPAPDAARSAQPVAPAATVAAVQVAPVAALTVVAPPQPASELSRKPAVQAAPKRTVSTKAPAPVVAAVEPPKKEEAAPVPAVVEPPPAAASEAAGIVAPGSVTITGCLEISTDGADFRLTDASGADVPKSRSWRSGFFKKRPAPVNLVSPSDRAALKADVGKRVAVTGQLADRDLRVGSVHVVGSCN